MAFNLNETIQGLGSTAIGIPAAGPTPVSGKLTLPTIVNGATDPATGLPASSQCIVTVTQTPNGGGPTTIYTGLAGSEGFGLTANCAALDTITVTLSSSANVDKQPNAIKCTISVG